MTGITPADPFAQFAVLLRDIERRIANLEQMNRLSNSSFTGRLRMIGPNGEDRGYLGELPDGGYGVQVMTADGTPVFTVDEGGLRRPALNLPYRAAQAPVTITDGEFVRLWETTAGSITHDALRWQSSIACDVGTTAEARLRTAGSGALAHYSGVIAVPAGTQTVCTWNWLHGSGVGTLPQYQLFQIEVRRTSGTGEVHVYGPDALFFATGEEIDATPSGL